VINSNKILLEVKVSAKGLQVLRAFRNNSGSKAVVEVLEIFLRNSKRCLVQMVGSDKALFRLKVLTS